MKIQCDVCERAEAALLCCADEAALCWRCDEQVHAANKLASKHQRVPLLPNNTSSSSSSSSSSPAAASAQAPICDICQEKAGYFFCLEDRALLCRNCDVGIHTSSPMVSSHQRFLITGVRVGLQQYITRSSNDNSSSNSTTIDRSNSTSSNCNSSNLISTPALANASIPQKKMRAVPTSIAAEETEEFRPQLQWNELFDLAEFDRCYGLSEPGSSSY